MRKRHQFTQIILVLFAATSLGCTREPAEPAPQQTQSSLQLHENPQDIAIKLCQYNRGPFPNWMQYQEITPYLTDSEAQAIQYIASRLLAEVPEKSQARYLAISKFIAQNTICTLQQTERRDQTGAIGFTLDQKYPTIPNVPDIQCHTTDESCISQWVTLLNNHWDGNYRDQQISIILERDNQQHYIMRTQIDKSYALPLKIQTFRQSLEKYDFELAAQQLYQICDSSDYECKNQWPFLNSAIAIARYSSAKFKQQIAINDIRFKAVSLTGNSGYTAAEITLTHHGQNAFNHIVFQTDEFPPQFCELQATRSYLATDPASILPGTSTKLWCILRQNTAPYINLEPLITNIIE